MQLNSKKESLDVAINRKEENNHEIKEGEQQHQRKLNNQTQSAIQYSRSQDDKLISNLINDKTPNNNVATPTANTQFYTKFVKRFTKQLRFSDST